MAVTHRWRPGRLQSRLTLVTSVLVLMTAGVITFLFHRLSVQSVERSRVEAAFDVAESIALRLSAGMPPEPILERILSEYVHANSDIVAANVVLGIQPERFETVSAFGMRLDGGLEQEEAAARRRPVSRIVEHAGERFWSVAVPIETDGNLSGAVGVWSSLQAVELVTKANRTLALVVLPGAVVLLVVLLGVVFQRQVHRPMELLREAMARAELGDLTAEAPALRSDEIGFIADQYNKMLARIRTTQEEREALLAKVQGFNEELSGRVNRATAALKARNAELERLNQELYHLQMRLVRTERRSVAQQMTARLAHKIGTPLNLVSGHVQMLKRTRSSDRELHDKLTLVQAQIDKLTRTVQDTLDETRASLRGAPLSLDRVLRNIGTLLAPTLTARGVELELGLRSAPAQVEGIEEQIEQVFLTLINNSLDAMPAGGHLKLCTRDAGDDIEVRLTDDGEGIPADVLPKIFRPFFTTKPDGRGTGLGLAIVQEILSAHRASIDVASDPRTGTASTIVFPKAGRPPA